MLGGPAAGGPRRFAMNSALHSTRFHVWWEHVDGSTGKIVRSTKEFRRKEEAALFIRKMPHLTSHGAAGCYSLTESKEVARDGKTRTTTVQQDIWTFREIAEMCRG
jgi:hypothetical protein